MEWRLAEAKNKFSEVVNRAISEGPQRVVRRDDAVVIMDEREYERLTGQRPSFKRFLLDAPDLSDLDLTRQPDPMRESGL